MIYVSLEQIFIAGVDTLSFLVLLVALIGKKNVLDETLLKPVVTKTSKKSLSVQKQPVV